MPEGTQTEPNERNLDGVMDEEPGPLEEPAGILAKPASPKPPYKS